ncbi:hypothetical protein F4703DRAFT_1790431 [Phycomyces blakesleeanus]
MKNNGDITFESLTQVWTNGIFGKDDIKLKGHRCGVAGKLYKSLKKREAEDKLIVIIIDKFKTSKTRSLCFFDNMKIINTKLFKGVAVVSCKQCNKVWQRDSNADKNMMSISESIWPGERRPDVFTPKKK